MSFELVGMTCCQHLRNTKPLAGCTHNIAETNDAHTELFKAYRCQIRTVRLCRVHGASVGLGEVGRPEKGGEDKKGKEVKARKAICDTGNITLM